MSYLSSEDDHTRVRIIIWDESRGGDVYLSAGYGSSGQGVGTVQVDSSLTATKGGIISHYRKMVSQRGRQAE